ALVPFQLLDFFKLRFDFADRFEVVLRHRRGRAAEQSIVRLDLAPQVISTVGHDDVPRHAPREAAPSSRRSGTASGFAGPAPITWPVQRPLVRFPLPPARSDRPALGIRAAV